jgi:hypothetical protein
MGMVPRSPALSFRGQVIDIAKLSKEEREFVTRIINRFDSGDVKNVGAELLAESVSALTAEVFQKGYRLGGVLCQGDRAEAFNEALAPENKSPSHMICVGYALSQEGKKTSTTSQVTA